MSVVEKGDFQKFLEEIKLALEKIKGYTDISDQQIKDIMVIVENVSKDYGVDWKLDDR